MISCTTWLPIGIIIGLLLGILKGKLEYKRGFDEGMRTWKEFKREA